MFTAPRLCKDSPRCRVCIDPDYRWVGSKFRRLIVFMVPFDVVDLRRHSLLVMTCPVVTKPPLQWRHNGHDSISNHQPYDCLLNRLFRRRSKKTSKFRVTGLCVGNLPVTGEFPAQMAGNAENVSIWWRHHDCRNQCWLPSIRPRNRFQWQFRRRSQAMWSDLLYFRS